MSHFIPCLISSILCTKFIRPTDAYDEQYPVYRKLEFIKNFNLKKVLAHH